MSEHTFPLSVRVRAADGVMMRELDGESVLLNLDSGHYFGLDDVGTRVWTLALAGPTLGDALHALEEEYDVAPEQLEADVQELLRQLVEHRLVEVDGGVLA